MVIVHYPTMVRSLKDALNPEEFNAYLSTITPETVFKGPVDEVVDKTSAYLDSLVMHRAASAVISWGEGLEEVFNSSPSGRILWIHWYLTLGKVGRSYLTIGEVWLNFTKNNINLKKEMKMENVNRTEKGLGVIYKNKEEREFALPPIDELPPVGKVTKPIEGLPNVDDLPPVNN